MTRKTFLVYYNYRYYSPVLGRWLSRDPIEEKGGWNLYGIAQNNAIMSWDMEGNGPIDWALTGEWNPSAEQYQAAKESFTSGKHIGVNPWLYTGEINPDEDAYNETLTAAAESVTKNLFCYKCCMKKHSTIGLIVGVHESIQAVPISKNLAMKVLRNSDFKYSGPPSSPYTSLTRIESYYLNHRKNPIKNFTNKIGKAVHEKAIHIKGIIKGKGISGITRYSAVSVIKGTIASEAVVSTFCSVYCASTSA